MTDSLIYASPMPGEMEGNEPDPVPADVSVVDQLPVTDIDDEELSV